MPVLFHVQRQSQIVNNNRVYIERELVRRCGALHRLSTRSEVWRSERHATSWNWTIFSNCSYHFNKKYYIYAVNMYIQSSQRFHPVFLDQGFTGEIPNQNLLINVVRAVHSCLRLDLYFAFIHSHMYGYVMSAFNSLISSFQCIIRNWWKSCPAISYSFANWTKLAVVAIMNGSLMKMDRLYLCARVACQ